MSTPNPDITKVIPQMDAGIFEQKINAAMASAALAALEHEKSASITLKFTFERLGAGQVNVKHQIQTSNPIKRGKTTREEQTETAFHVAPNGALDFFPHSQIPIFAEE